MGFLDTLFGGSKSSSKPKDVTPPELAGLRAPFADTIKTLLGGTGQEASLSGIPQFEGPLVAPMTPGEQAAVEALSVNDPLSTARRDLLTRTMGGEFLPGQPGSNPFLQSAIEAAQRTNLQGLEETLSRSLPGRFNLAGHQTQPGGSSAFDRAAAVATRGVAQANADIASNMSFGAYESERGKQQEAVALGQQEVETMVTNLQAQALPRLIEDMGIERGLEEFQKRIANLLQALAITTSAPLQNVAQVEKSQTKPNIFGTLFPQGFQPSGPPVAPTSGG